MHPLAVEADDDAERAVGRRVLRTQVEDHVAGVELDVDLRVGEMPVDARVDLDVGERRVRGAHDSTPDSAAASAAAASPSASSPALVRRRFVGHRLDVDEARPRLHDTRQQREVLAQRMPLELRREIEVAQRRMALEDDAEHLPALALVPVGAGVDRHPRLGEHGLLVDVDLQREPPVPRRGLDVREHLEATVGAGGAVGDFLRLDG